MPASLQPCGSFFWLPVLRKRTMGLLLLSLLGGTLVTAQTQSPATPMRSPGDGVLWTNFLPQKSKTDPLWGEFLTDLETHLPAQYGTKFQSEDRVIHAHETTHGINAHLRNLLAGNDRCLPGFYVGANRAALIQEPACVFRTSPP